MKFWSSGDGTGSRVEKKWKTIDLGVMHLNTKPSIYTGNRIAMISHTACVMSQGM
jgi:hypothetical protein